MKRFVVVATALLLGAGSGGAQSTAALRRGDRFVATSFATPFHTDAGPNIALVRDRKVYMAAWQSEWVLAASEGAALAWTLEVPVALVLPDKDAPEAECWRGKVSRNLYCYPVADAHRPVAAVGITPLGLRAYVNHDDVVRPIGGLAIGVVRFDRQWPVRAASAFNFALEYTLGLEFVAPSGNSALTMVWKFQHWSNAGATRFNPGVEANLLQLGFKRRRH